ncbi:PLDc N-terminal domain-containing protein [Microbacterium sp. NPDC019599]|uniref:SHOCT domain-containing protein n=1 Tax=Microbacterium sp. NPDC019599 TaxID=3154690 RepID=UPI00340CDE29
MHIFETVEPISSPTDPSIFWYFVLVFVFVAYLSILFSILGDLFRDRELNGWLKAVWVIFLIFVPFLTALIYLVVRGRHMAERQQRMLEQQRAAQAEYIQKVAAAPPSASEEIARAKALLDSAAISQAEFDAIKAKALG